MRKSNPKQEKVKKSARKTTSNPIKEKTKSKEIFKLKKSSSAIKLQESEDRFRTLVENTPIGVWQDDAEGKTVYVNPAMCTMLEVDSPEELYRKNWQSFFTAESLDRIKHEHKKRLKGFSSSYEVILLGKQGGQRDVLVYGAPLFSAACALQGTIATFFDITRRKKAEEALKESEACLKTAIESLPFEFFLLDEDGRYTMQNTICKQNWGDIIGKRPEDLSVNKDTLEVWKNNNRRAFGGEVVKDETILHPKGGAKYYYNIISPIRDTNKTRGILGINIDITERKEAEKILMQREKELQDQTQNLEELNTALKVLLHKRQEDKIQGEEKIMMNIRELVKPYLEKTKNEGLNRSQKTYMDIIESNLEEIVSSFTVRMSSSHLNLTPTEIQVANLIKQGKRSKEIAELMHSSPKAVAFHRGNIRKKLGLQNKKTNLRSYLLSCFQNSK